MVPEVENPDSGSEEYPDCRSEKYDDCDRDENVRDNEYTPSSGSESSETVCRVLSRPTSVTNKFPSHLPRPNTAGSFPSRPFSSLTKLTNASQESIINPNMLQIFFWYIFCLLLIVTLLTFNFTAFPLLFRLKLQTTSGFWTTPQLQLMPILISCKETIQQETTADCLTMKLQMRC